MYNNQRTDERNTVKDVISADNYGKILQNVLQQLMPTYDVSAAKLKDQAAANANAIDIDAEKRGIFNSGAAATLQQNNQKDLTQNLAALLADLQSQSVDQARQYVGQQLEGTGQLGDWTTSDQSAGLDALKSKLAAAFNLDEAELNRTLGLGGLAVDQQNANTNAQNANTNQYNAQTDRMVGLGNLQIDRAKLDESVRQFNLSFQQANEFHADDMKQFAQQMGFNYAQLGSEERRAAASQALQSAGLQLDYAKFNSEQDLIKYQQKMQGLTDYKDAYDMLSQVDAAGAQKGWSADQIYQAKKDLIAPYSAYNSDLYKDLLSGIKTDYEKSTTSPLLSIPASNDLWNKMQGFTSKETYSPLLSKTANLTNSIKNILSK
jgi:hypothetical protein